MQTNKENPEDENPPPMALNHVSRLCSDVKTSTEFYTDILGFVPTERPSALQTYDGAWLFNYGIGIHLVQTKDTARLPNDSNSHLDPMDNHISFQCEDMEAMVRKLEERGVEYLKRKVDGDESGTGIDQLFFKDPDGFMIEVCNCENLKLVPTGSVGKIRLVDGRHNPPVQLENSNG